jgi:hypothetical protein
MKLLLNLLTCVYIFITRFADLYIQIYRVLYFNPIELK